MTDFRLASLIADGLVSTGIEGDFGSVCCSTGGDYPSIGCSSWEGERADDLLLRIEGGERFVRRSYSDLLMCGDLPVLSDILRKNSAVQIEKLSEDCISYVDALSSVETLFEPRCIIYAGMWCPTSVPVVLSFLRRYEGLIDLNDIALLNDMFIKGYARYADCSEYAAGYENRANGTYRYVLSVEV